MIIDSNGPFQLIRGARPADEGKFLNIKFKTVVSLQVGWFEAWHGKQYQEDLWAARAHRQIIHYPLSDFRAPTRAELSEVVGIIRMNFATQSVFFHCLHGVDRTGMVAAAYRILIQAWPIEDAIDEMMDQGFHKFPYLPWVKTLREFRK